MKRITNKQELDAMIATGIKAPDCAEIGCYRLDFRPFEQDENLLKDFKTIAFTECMPDSEENITSLAECAFSTIYKGYRWYFETPAQLKNFCEIVGQA